jgi:protein-disulfide isomerase
MYERRQAELKRKKAVRLGLIAGGIAVALAAVLVVVLVVVPTLTPPETDGDGVTPPHATAEYAIVIKDTADVPVVDLFFDYQCPGCGQLERSYGEAFASLSQTGAIKLVYHPFKFLDNNLQNDSSTRASVAAACADTVGAYEAFHNAIFQAQPAKEGDGYTDETLRVTIPGQVGITGDNLTAFQTCYDEQQTLAWVNAASEAGSKAGVTSTPTVKVNGNDLPTSEVYQIAMDDNRPANLLALIKSKTGV